MATEEMFTSLPTVSNAQMTDIICAVQGYSSPTVLGTSVQETLQQVYNLFQSNIVVTYAGNPNGFVAGQTFNLCWDSADNILWVCTVSGVAGVAVWTKSIQLTAGTGITIVQSGSNITISAAGASGLSWNHVTGTSATMVSDNAYVADNAGTCSLTLPATANFGDIIYVTGLQGTWSILTGGGGKTIKIGTSSASTSVTSTSSRDAINLVCVVTNTTWQAFNAPQSLGLTIV